MLSQKIQDAFNRQLNAELYSAYLYVSMSAYFESINLKGMANWMRVQAGEEVQHAERFYNFIHERGGRVLLAAIEGPKIEWHSPVEVFEETCQHEAKVTGLINELVDLAIKEKDHAANAFLQWFVTEQVEEEASADEVLQQLKMMENAPGGMFMLDRELGQRVFTPPAQNSNT